MDAAPADNGQPMEWDSLRALRVWLSTNHPDAGSRLPPERILAETLAVSRPELRKALMILEAEGRITRHVGRGTFVSDLRPLALSAPVINELADRTSPHEAMMARLSLEPELAHLAALHATPSQINRARTLTTQLREADTWAAYEDLDHKLHDLIAEASGNPLLHELHKVLNAVRHTVVWLQLAPGSTRPAPDYHSFDEHDAIVTAIANRDRRAAKLAMRVHLSSTLDAMSASED